MIVEIILSIMDSAALVFAYLSCTFFNLVSCFENVSFAYQRNANVIVLFTISLGLFNLKRVHFFYNNKQITSYKH